MDLQLRSSSLAVLVSLAMAMAESVASAASASVILTLEFFPGRRNRDPIAFREGFTRCRVVPLDGFRFLVLL